MIISNNSKENVVDQVFAYHPKDAAMALVLWNENSPFCHNEVHQGFILQLHRMIVTAAEAGNLDGTRIVIWMYQKNENGLVTEEFSIGVMGEKLIEKLSVVTNIAPAPLKELMH